MMCSIWLWTALERLCGLHDEHIARVRFYTNFFIIPLIFLYLAALIDKRRIDYNGQITFRQGFRTGLVLTAILAALSPLTQYVIAKVVSPHFFENAIALVVSQDLIPEEEARKFFSLGNYIRHSILTTPLFGMLITLFVAIIAPKIGKNSPKENLNDGE